MKMRLFLTCLILPLALTSYCFAAPEEEEGKQPEPRLQLWQAKLDDTSKITLSVSQIVSVAMHPYMLNGENLITEVTIDTLGNNTIRFYYVHTDDEKTDYTNPESVVKNARKRLSQSPSQPKAQKNSIASIKFPEGAYAHTIEYQVSSLETLESLFKSLTSVWEKSSKKRTSYKVTDTDSNTDNESSKD